MIALGTFSIAASFSKTKSSPIVCVLSLGVFASQFSGKSSSSTSKICVLSGISIPFKIEKPMSYEAFKSWSKYSDPDYIEKYCHFYGETSNRETSVIKPILKKNWKKAKEVFGL